MIGGCIATLEGLRMEVLGDTVFLFYYLRWKNTALPSYICCSTDSLAIVVRRMDIENCPFLTDEVSRRDMICSL